MTTQESQRLTADEIKHFLSTNQNNHKRHMLKSLDAIVKVNELLTNDDISSLRHDSMFFDSLNDIVMTLEDTLDLFFASHLNVPENNNEIMLYLHFIYA